MRAMKSIRALQEIIFPSRCLGCGQLGLEICSLCRKNWHPHIYRQWSQHLPTFPIYSAVSYSPIAGKVLLAAKENNLAVADQLIYRALSHSLSYLMKEIGGDFLVPIPSRRSVARSRGRQFIAALTSQLSTETGLPAYENLEHIRRVRDQSSLDATSRFHNLDGSMKSLSFLSGTAIIVDDLVTTGATLQEAVRALRDRGIEVAAAVTACVAEPLR
ncbi:ComFC Predicted amidophosphoribosyltransferases [Candidatus Nanopelagicaceae bacterium]